jgi:hypothetical protein
MRKYMVTITGGNSSPVLSIVNGEKLAIPKNIPLEIDAKHYYNLRNMAKQRASADALIRLYVEKTDLKWEGDGNTLEGIRAPAVRLRKGAPLKVE